MRLEARAPTVWYSRLSKDYITKAKQGLREEGKNFWPDPEDDLCEYTGWRGAPDERDEVLVCTEDGDDSYVPVSDLRVVKVHISADGAATVDASASVRRLQSPSSQPHSRWWRNSMR